MPLHPPPSDASALLGFPTVELPRLTAAWRIRRPFDRAGRAREVFWFAARPEAGGPDHAGRYALPGPHGASYWAASAQSAWLETFREARRVDLVDLRDKALCGTRLPRTAGGR